jgi:hypothetical protein
MQQSVLAMDKVCVPGAASAGPIHVFDNASAYLNKSVMCIRSPINLLRSTRPCRESLNLQLNFQALRLVALERASTASD